MSTTSAANGVQYVLSDEERQIITGAVARMTGATQEMLVQSSETIYHEIRSSLSGLCGLLDTFSDEATSPGLGLLYQLPTTTNNLALTVLVARLLGTPSLYAGEGDYVMEVRDEGTKPGQRPSFSNAREFFLHSDLSYVPIPPRFFLLHSLANDASAGGHSEFCLVRDIVKNNGLSPLALAELQKPNFEFAASVHFKGGAVPPMPILTKAQDGLTWRIRFRRDSLKTITRPAIDALVELVRALRARTFEVSLAPNSVAVVDNWALLHGRTAFAPQPAPRHINRIYVNPAK